LSPDRLYATLKLDEELRKSCRSRIILSPHAVLFNFTFAPERIVTFSGIVNDIQAYEVLHRSVSLGAPVEQDFPMVPQLSHVGNPVVVRHLPPARLYILAQWICREH